MKILVIGSGGREHAIVWKLSQSSRVDRIFCAPGNGGIKGIAEVVDIKSDDIKGLLKFSKENKIDITVVGPEQPLVDGIVDVFIENGLKIFGPTKDLARLEGSKIFAKEIMKRYHVPTADFRVFGDVNNAKRYLRQRGVPIVIKADGLCAGKGVRVVNRFEEGDSAIEDALLRRVFGSSGERIIIEECLLGEEASVLVFSDGTNIVPLPSAQDHKRVFDGDMGPNTGGMGAYSPAPVAPDEILWDIVEKIFMPVIDGLRKEGRPYKGILYGGLMFTENGPMVLEYNVRFGDPETQAILPRLKTDLVDIIEACIDGCLDRIRPEWDKRHCLSVVLASKGYPGDYEKGKEIYGLKEINLIKDVLVFHAGTIYKDGRFFTNGGRVLAVTGIGDDIISARDIAYQALEKIYFEGMHYRKDIGKKALCRL